MPFSNEENGSCSPLEEAEGCPVRGFTTLTANTDSSPLTDHPRPQGSPSSISSGYESEMGDPHGGLDLSTPDSPPFSPLSADLLTTSMSSGVSSYSSPGPELAALTKSTLDSQNDYNFTKCPIGFCTLLDKIQCDTPCSKMAKSPVLDVGSPEDPSLDCDPGLSSPTLPFSTGISSPQISLADHSYMATRGPSASCSSTSRPSPSPVSPPSSAILATQDFDPSGLSLSPSLDLDWLDMSKIGSPNVLLSSMGLDSDTSLLADPVFPSRSSAAIPLSTRTTLAPSSSYAPTISYACTRSVANDHDYSAKPKDEPVSRKKACSPPPMLPFLDNFSDALGDLDVTSDSFLRSAQPVFMQPQPVAKSAKRRYRGNSNGRSSDSLLGALLGSSRLGAVATEARSSVAGLSSRFQQSFSPPKVATGLAIGGFATDMLSSSSDLLDAANLSSNFPTDKFADNLPEQRVRNQWLSYLAGESKVPPKPLPRRRSSATATATATSPISPPHSARTSGMSYSQHHAYKKQASSSAARSSKPATTSHPPTKGSSLLEKFLLTEKPLNPMQGSDKVFPDERVTQSMSQLRLGTEEDGTLLKQLLTGEIGNDKVEQYEQTVIEDRRLSADNDDLEFPMDTDTLTQEAKDLGLELFDHDLNEDVESFLGNFTADVAVGVLHYMDGLDQDCSTSNLLTMDLLQSCLGLAHWGQDKMAAIWQTTFSNSFFFNENRFN